VSGPPPCTFRSRTGHPAHRDYTGLAAAQLRPFGQRVLAAIFFIVSRGAITVLAGQALWSCQTGYDSPAGHSNRQEWQASADYTGSIISVQGFPLAGSARP